MVRIELGFSQFYGFDVLVSTTKPTAIERERANQAIVEMAVSTVWHS